MRRLPALLVLLLLPLTGCANFEHICSQGEYPTWRPDGPGAACTKDGEEPPAGYVAYPEGDVPEMLNDHYDPLRRYPELKDWAKKYVAWQDSGAEGTPPPMPDVEPVD